MKCTKCGLQIDSTDFYCRFCGTKNDIAEEEMKKKAEEEKKKPIDEDMINYNVTISEHEDGHKIYDFSKPQKQPKGKAFKKQRAKLIDPDKLDTYGSLLCFFMPISGFVIFFVERGENPHKARAALMISGITVVVIILAAWITRLIAG